MKQLNYIFNRHAQLMELLQQIHHGGFSYKVVYISSPNELNVLGHKFFGFRILYAYICAQRTSHDTFSTFLVTGFSAALFPLPLILCHPINSKVRGAWINF